MNPPLLPGSVCNGSMRPHYLRVKYGVGTRFCKRDRISTISHETYSNNGRKLMEDKQGGAAHVKIKQHNVD